MGEHYQGRLPNMDKPVMLPSDADTRYRIPVMAKRRFIEEVFLVKEPCCPGCNKEMEFSVFENFQDSGVDWIQWRCKAGCGFMKNIEII